MKTYQIRSYVCEGGKFDLEKAELADIVELTLENPVPSDNVFGILKQWQVETDSD